MKEKVEINIGFGWILIVVSIALGVFPSLQSRGWVPPIFLDVAVSYSYSLWLGQASLSYMLLTHLVPRYPIGIVLAGIECLTVLFIASSIYGEQHAWEIIHQAFAEEAPIFESKWLQFVLLMHTSYALGLFVFWLDYWGNQEE